MVVVMVVAMVMVVVIVVVVVVIVGDGGPTDPTCVSRAARTHFSGMTGAEPLVTSHLLRLESWPSFVA